MNDQAKETQGKIEDKFDSAVEVGQKAVRKAVEAQSKGYEKAVSASKENVDKYVGSILTGLDEATKLQKEGNEILKNISDSLRARVEDLGRDAVQQSQRSAEKQMGAFKEALSAKSVEDLVEIQSKLANEIYQDFVSNVNSASKVSQDLAKEISSPVQKYLQQVSNQVTNNLR